MSDSSKSAQELWGAVVKSMIVAQRQVEDWNLATFILSATGAWLNAHARDRGTFRQFNESDAALASRLRTYDDAVTVPAVLAAVQAVLTAEGVTSPPPAMVELRQSKAFFGVCTPQNGTGGTFTKMGSVMTLDVTTPLVGNEVGRTVTVAGAFTSGNNGTFTITGITSAAGHDQLVYINSGGVVESLGSGTWQLDINYLNRRSAYMGRGYRMARNVPSSFVVILPYPAVAGVLAGVAEALRKKKAGGFGAIVEQRVDP